MSSPEAENNPDLTEQSRPSSSIPFDRRFKLSRACDRCRRRRIKCDEGYPCQPCLTATSDCTFEETAKRTPSSTKKHKTFMLEARMRQLESIIDAIPPATLAAIQAGIYREDPTSVGIADGAWSMLHAPREDNGGDLGAYDYASSSTYSNPPALYCEPVFRGTVAPPHETDVTHPGPQSKFFLDEHGDAQWHGLNSGLPLLQMLTHAQGYQSFNTAQYGGDMKAETVDLQNPMSAISPSTSVASGLGSVASVASSVASNSYTTASGVVGAIWDNDSTVASSQDNDDGLGITWATISSAIPAELMDELVRAFLQTSYYLYPFLHLPTFLKDYSSPNQWSDPGFSAFIVSLCCLSSLHTDNSALRESNNDIVARWFELFLQLRTLPGSERPTLYGIQAAFIGAVYAFGKGLTSKGQALIAEAATRAIEAGLHRSADAYDWFDPIQDQVRKRTFWCIYLWDKQASAQFGRHPMLRLRDCDVGLPALVNDEHITLDHLHLQSSSTDTLMAAFACMCQLGTVLDSVLDTPPSRSDKLGSFLERANALISGAKRNGDLFEEEELLNDAVNAIPPRWAYTSETLTSGDMVRISQAERLHCLESLVRLLIHRRRFSSRAADRIDHGIERPQTDEERNAIRSLHAAASEIISVHKNAVQRGLVTYYGIHNVHQIIQASRSSVAIILESRMDPQLRDILTPMVDNIRAAFMLCRHFGKDYVDGMRASYMLEEICFLTQIPIGIPAEMSNMNAPKPRVKPVNHIRKKPTGRESSSRLIIPASNYPTAPMSLSALSPTESNVIPNISRFPPNINTPNDSPSNFRSGPF